MCAKYIKIVNQVKYALYRATIDKRMEEQRWQHVSYC